MLRLQPHITALDGDWTRLRYSPKRREAIGDTEVLMDAGWSDKLHSPGTPVPDAMCCAMHCVLLALFRR